MNHLHTSLQENKNKNELLLTKLQSKIDITLRLNKLKNGMIGERKMDTLIDEISKLTTISEKEQQHYITEVNQLYNGRILKLTEKYAGITEIYQIVIALICLNVDILDCCILLSINQNTLYVRRKRIKKLLEIEGNFDLEVWVKKNITYDEISQTHLSH